MPLPDDIDISCQYQILAIGGLKCRAANITGNSLSNNCNDDICYKCEAGKIYRELGCKHISPKIWIHQSSSLNIYSNLHILHKELFCSLRKRETNYNYCCSCTLVNSEFTKLRIDETKGLFEASGFKSSLIFLQEAKDKLNNNPDGCITSSNSSLESTCKTILDKLGESYPDKQQLTNLWDKVKNVFNLGDEIAEPLLKQAIGSITGAIYALAGIRNALSDAHGKGLISSEVYSSYAEITLNLSGSISSFLIRRLKEIEALKS